MIFQLGQLWQDMRYVNPHLPHLTNASNITKCDFCRAKKIR